MLVRLDRELVDDQRAVGPARPRRCTIPGGGGCRPQDQRRLLDRRPEPAGQGAQTAACSPGFTINHIVDVNFSGFEELVNAIGCVYTDVDHRYYNNTAVHRLLEHRHPARLPEAVRHRRARLRALPPHRHRPRAQRAPAGLPALGQGAVRRRTAGRQPRQAAEDLRPAHADRRTTCTRVDGLFNLFNLVAFSAGPHDQADPVPGDLPAVRVRRDTTTPRAAADRGDAVLRDRDRKPPKRAAYSAFMRPPSAARTPRRARQAAPSATVGAVAGDADLTGDVGDGQAQAAELDLPVAAGLLPAADRGGVQYCTDEHLQRAARSPTRTRAPTGSATATATATPPTG